MSAPAPLPLLLSNLIAHADRQHGDTPVLSRRVEDPRGPLQRSNWRGVHGRARRFANALGSLGVRQGDRVATLAWNTHRHLELYYAISGSGAVCHTVNPRLYEAQLAWILNDSRARVLCFDLSFSELVAGLAPQLQHVEHFVLLSDEEHLPAAFPAPLRAYETLLAEHGDDYAWPLLDENSPAGLCYTSGTTGNPKGVLYSHRTTVLQVYSCALPDTFGLSARDVVMPVTPMYHVNGWGVPYIAALVGASLVLPGPLQDGPALLELINAERVTFSNGVPTLWSRLLDTLNETGTRIDSLRRLAVGGSTCPPALIDAYAARGIELRHCWGMTEVAPIGLISTPKADHEHLDPETRAARRDKQGRPLPGVVFRILDDDGRELPHDGTAFGELVVRAPWVVGNYFNRDSAPDFTADGWFRTGDVATIDPAGYVRITDRAKDVIKSGGEWISSIELENILLTHPAVQDAAAIAVAHPQWNERPLMAVVLRPGETLERDAMRAHFEGKVAKWWIPDDLVEVDKIPYTGTGKVSKRELREAHAGHQWPA
ncbi:long-chain-fatty-acid--CoA ligase [Pseudothauera nasutitermitis]|uniref:Long-chain-fatty-acid--CoA ligase n=1 Tax=Pseudothauera nasutitermitis TaxID=2565930 RepID=A0A4S4B3N9_9RHOO|nr:long-chain-fatty-acid--CoA ligase [Pseudothauera nasutitermitis]THF67297.1 long-chain-fatty-acid--CoA ligase [Pseudothauera nasutitermitis]